MIEDVRRMVVKVGTAIITGESGRINRQQVKGLVSQVGYARNNDIDVVLVSSGAIAAGMERMEMTKRTEEMPTLQAAASIGQGILIEMYTNLFTELGIPVGQVLLTQNDLINRDQYVNARHTLERLFDFGAVPVVNENDTVATEEIAFGENDFLAAQVAALIRADLLVLLTDTPGLHTSDPRLCEDAELLSRVETITDEIESFGGGKGSHMASGGMTSKIQAAKIAVCSGVGVVIADGRESGVITHLLDGECGGTYFPPNERTISAKKVWIAFSKSSRGNVVVDEGAASAVEEKGKSLLAAGVVETRGDFQEGDAIEIEDEKGKVFGKGLVNYNREDLENVRGLKSDKIENVLGREGKEVIHRDYLVLYKQVFRDHKPDSP